MTWKKQAPNPNKQHKQRGIFCIWTWLKTQTPQSLAQGVELQSLAETLVSLGPTCLLGGGCCSDDGFHAGLAPLVYMDPFCMVSCSFS